MSQEKVDKYKKEKANRRKNMHKAKIYNVLRKCAVAVVGFVLVGWIGYSAYGTYEANRPKDTIQIDYTALDELTQNMDEAAAQAAQ